MKKKILSILLIGILVVGLTGCGNKEEVNNDDHSTDNDTTQTDTAQTNKEYEIETLNKNQIKSFERYDSGKFYYENAEISYSVPSKYVSKEKRGLHGIVTEEYRYTNDDNDIIYLLVESSNKDFYGDLVESKDLGEGCLQETLKIEGLAADAFEGSEKEFNIKNIKVGDYNVYYTEFESNNLGYETSGSKNIYLAFNVVDNYTVQIRLYSFKYNKDSNEVSMDTLKPIIESFKATIN